MADVDIAVDSGDLKAAITLLNEYGMSFTGMVNKVQTEGNRLARASKATSDQVNQAWKRAESILDNRELEQTATQEARILKQREQNWKQFFQNYGKNPSASQGGAPNSAASSALLQNEKALADAMQDSARAAKLQEQEIATLTARYNPLVAAQQAYVRMKGEINRANDIGIIDAKQQTVALQQLEKEYLALSAGTYLAGSRFNQFGEMAVQSGRGAQRFGMYAQQAGYQVGDFFVQLQGGQNIGVAFSQQMAQLSGLIPGVAGALTTFASIGLGMLIQNMTRGGEEAKDTYADLSKFSDLEQIFNSVGSSFETSMVQSLSRVRQEYGDFVADFAKFSLNSEIDKLKANLSTVMDEATINDPDSSAGFFGRNFQLPNTDLSSAMKAAEDAKSYNDMLAEVQAAQDRLFNGSINSKSELVTAYQDVYQTMLGIPGITQEILDRFVEVGGESGIAAEQIKVFGESWTNANEQAGRAFELYRQQNQELRQSNELAAIKLQHGEDSVQYMNAERDQILSSLEAEMRRAGVQDTLIDKIITMKAEQVGYEQSVQRATAAVETLQTVLEGISGIDISGVFLRAEAAASGLLGTVNAIGRGMSQLGKLGMEAKALQAENAALAGGASPGEARVAGQVVRYGDSLNIPDGPLNNIAKGMLTKAYENQSLQNLTYTEENSEITKAWNKANGSGGGKGSKAKLSDAEKDAKKASERLNEFFDQFEIGMEQQERLLGVYGQAREELEKVIEIENRLGEARHLVSQAQIEAMANEELALERKLDREQAIYDLGSSNVESLLMTVVDGTASIEDAFKSMLSNIILEVYKNYVAKGAADVAGNALVSLFSAKGNAFGAGGIKMFADGGVVNSPTLFGYGGGKTGMMGEAGPEAIMPLKRNTQGQLGVAVSGGSSGNVNVYHTINVSANGDDSVNRIIQAQIPRITEASKRAVIDANRRSQKGFR